MSDLIQLETLPVETLAEMANEAAAACEASGRKTVEHAATCGRALLAIRPQIPHGEWLDWLGENFNQSQTRASQYMEIANYYARNNLESAETIQGALRMIAATPEKQARKAEREAKKLEAPPKPSAPATIRHESPPAPQPQPERPAWLADPDELDRDTDRQGLVSPDDPRELQDGRLYIWRESANRLFLATPDEIWEAAMEVIPEKLAEYSGAPTPDLCDTKKVVERERD